MTKGQKYWERTLRLRDVLLSIIQFLPPHHKRGLAVPCQYFEYMTCPEVFLLSTDLLDTMVMDLNINRINFDD